MSSEAQIGVSVIYSIVTFSLIFSIASVVFAYKLSRLTGLFSAWILQILGLVLVAFEDFIYFGSIALESPAKMQAAVVAMSAESYVIIAVILLGTPLAFFLAMYKMYSIFRSQKNESSRELSIAEQPLMQS